MTALVLENLGLLPALARSLRMLLARLARTLDDLVSAKAARTVPEWRMQEVQRQIASYRKLIQTSSPVTQSNVEPVSGRLLRKKGIFRIPPREFQP